MYVGGCFAETHLSPKMDKTESCMVYMLIYCETTDTLRRARQNIWLSPMVSSTQ